MQQDDYGEEQKKADLEALKTLRSGRVFDHRLEVHREDHDGRRRRLNHRTKMRIWERARGIAEKDLSFSLEESLEDDPFFDSGFVGGRPKEPWKPA